MGSRRQGRGSMLMSVLVGFGLVGILTVFITRLLSNASKGQRNLAASASFTNLTTQVIAVFRNPELCGGAFRDGTGTSVVFAPTNSTPVPVTTLRIGDAVVAAANTPLAELLVTVLELEKVSGTSMTLATVAGVNYEKWVALFRVRAEKKLRHAGEANPMVMKEFLLNVYTDPTTHRIARCNEQDGTSIAQLCIDLGGTWNGTACKIGPDASEMCTSMGGTFTASPAKCDLAPPGKTSANCSSAQSTLAGCTGGSCACVSPAKIVSIAGSPCTAASESGSCTAHSAGGLGLGVLCSGQCCVCR